MTNKTIIVAGVFDDLRSRGIRFLQEAAKSGPLTVLLYDDETALNRTGVTPKFPVGERAYFLKASRFVSDVKIIHADCGGGVLPVVDGLKPSVWAVESAEANHEKITFCKENGIELRIITDAELAGFPTHSASKPSGRKKVIVTGCYDWFHSGHVRFFEEVSTHGDLYVVVGHDANIRFLKGEGHPLIPEDERCYVAGSVRYVTQALVSTGEGWLDADPEIKHIKPDIYAVNEDGDKGGKREYCEKMGIEYLVLRRTPAPGLPRRSSTDLRGF
jgi:cytidyltransferase-like protein